MESKNDLYYIKLIKRGQVEAFAHIVRLYNRMVFTIVHKIVYNREEAEDITQEIFIKVFQNIEKFREQSEFSTWLYRIAYNTAISELRKRNKLQLSLDDTYGNIANIDVSDVEDGINIEQQLVYLDEILKIMPSEDALLVTMFYLNKHSVKDISEIVGQSIANVKVRLYRIRKYMNGEMNKLIKDGL